MDGFVDVGSTMLFSSSPPLPRKLFKGLSSSSSSEDDVEEHRIPKECNITARSMFQSLRLEVVCVVVVFVLLIFLRRLLVSFDEEDEDADEVEIGEDNTTDM